MTSFRIAQISDLHFSSFSWHPAQFFSKRWLGNLNLLFSRKKDYGTAPLALLPSLFQRLNVNVVAICGDLTTTSEEKEFQLGVQFLKELKAECVIVPGNHDHYTQKAYAQKRFYHYFSPAPQTVLPSFSLKQEGVSARFLGNLGKGAPSWWLVMLDTACATSLTSSEGYFSPHIEANLKKLLKQLPSSDQVILINHFPLFNNDHTRKALKRREALQTVLRTHPQVKLYLHGHSHRHCIADLRADHLPIILDAGSTAHMSKGSWNLIEITPQECIIDTFHWGKEWQKGEQKVFIW